MLSQQPLATKLGLNVFPVAPSKAVSEYVVVLVPNLQPRLFTVVVGNATDHPVAAVPLALEGAGYLTGAHTDISS